MKIVSIILSLFLLGANLIPCSDLATTSSLAPLEEAQLAQQDQNHEDTHSSSADFCSPFCSCHCCHTQVVTGNGGILVSKIEYTLNKASLRYSNYFSRPSFSIWQPPKIA